MIFKGLAGIPNVAVLVRSTVHAIHRHGNARLCGNFEHNISKKNFRCYIKNVVEINIWHANIIT